MAGVPNASAHEFPAYRLGCVLGPGVAFGGASAFVSAFVCVIIFFYFATGRNKLRMPIGDNIIDFRTAYDVQVKS